MSKGEGTITKPLLRRCCGEFDIESIHTLKLKNKDLDDLGCLGECVSLERLDLSRNDISGLYTLASLTNLNYLNLSCNRITHLDGLQALDNLVTLNLAGNLIGSTDTVRCVANLEKLTSVRLKDDVHELSNPVCLNNSYRHDVLNILPKLTILDGEKLKGKGSELYQMFHQLDKRIKVTEEALMSSRDGTSTWIPQEELEVFNVTSVENTEQQLQNLLQDCENLVQSAEDKLQTWTSLRQNGGAGDHA